MQRLFANRHGYSGHLRFLATIEDPPIVTKILAHLFAVLALVFILASALVRSNSLAARHVRE